MTAEGLGRREFLRGAGAAAVAGLVAPILSSASSSCAPSDPLREALANYFSDPEAARIVGRVYLNEQPGERDTRRLVERLAGEALDDWEILARRDPGALRSAIRERHRDDFRSEAIVSLDGWRLSRTEARLCALAAGH